MSCDANCINIGYKTLTQIIEAIIQGSIQPPSSAAMVIQLLTNTIQTFQCSLPPDIENKITQLINQIVTQSETTVKNVNTLYVIVIFTVLLLIVIFNYMTIYVSWLFFILSIIVVIVGALIMYFGVNRLYNTETISATLQDIKKLLVSVSTAGQLGLCCLGGCSNCISC